MNRTQNCAKCEYVRIYDYGKRIYYCDHECRENDMGKLGMNDLVKSIPKWCPLKKEGKYGSLIGFLRQKLPAVCGWMRDTNTRDIIQMDTNMPLRDKDGKPIEIRVPEPEYMSDI